MKKLLPFLLSLLLLIGCKPTSYLSQRDIYLVSVADDFYGYNGGNRKLSNVISDQAALISQFQTLGDIHVMAFLSQEGKRYYSETPHYVPCDRVGSTISEQSDLTFRSFRYVPEEEEMDWTMKDVLSAMEEIPAGEDDLIIFTYSGHGEEKTGSLLTHADRNKPLYDTISVSDIMDKLESLGGNKVAFIDSCFSGFFIEKEGISSADVFSEENHIWEKTSYWEALGDSLEHMEAGRDRGNLWGMAASTCNQEAADGMDYDDSPFQTSFGGFTYYLLKALGYDTDHNEPERPKERVTFYSLYRKVRESFPQAQTIIQTPQATLKAIDLVFLE